MKYTKIPRKLKKKFKKIKLASHSKSFIKSEKITLKKINIKYFDSDRKVFSSDFK